MQVKSVCCHSLRYLNLNLMKVIMIDWLFFLVLHLHVTLERLKCELFVKFINAGGKVM
jgi:hypothetical protein